MIRINTAGWLYILVTILIGLSAVNTGNNLIYIIASALLSYLVVSGIFGRRNIYGLDAEVCFPQEVFARTEALAEVRVQNLRKRMPAFLVTIEVGGGSCFFAYIAPKSVESGFFPVTFPARGATELTGAVISSNFPFNFFKRFRTIKKKWPVTVYPVPLRCSLSAFVKGGSRHRGERDLNKPGYEADILSIRDYVPGDPPKYINWKSTAKTGRLKVKELSSVERRQVTIELDSMGKEGVERALSCATHAILGFMRTGVPVGLRIGGETLRPGLTAVHKRLLLTRLALYGQN